ncbi:MAG: hypothetical protein NTU41_11475 [Chloroflexi bacterium]|nr:hypothetical protein [Chloroflexota bacterium]
MAGLEEAVDLDIDGLLEGGGVEVELGLGQAGLIAALRPLEVQHFLLVPELPVDGGSAHLLDGTSHHGN